MARIDWVDIALENWAMWKLQRDRGSSGWPTQAALMDVRTRGGYREARMPIIDHEAAVMDQAVRALERDDARLHRTVVLMYLGHPERGALTVLGVADAEGIAARTVYARLAEADRCIAIWFRTRADAQK